MNTGIHIGADKESIGELGEQIVRILQVGGVQEETLRHAITCLTSSMSTGACSVSHCDITVGESQE